MKMETLRRVCLAGGIAGLLLSVNVLAQERIVPIASGQGVIEQTINGDAAGRASNPNTVYQLERDGYYTIMTPISNKGFHLKIRGAAGTGKRPIVRPEAGTARCFLPTGDLTLEGLYINAVGNAGTPPISARA